MTRMVILGCLGVAATVGVARPAHAEVQLWSELGAKWEPTDRLAVTLDQDLRFDNDVSRVGAAITEPGLTYRFLRWLRAGAGYRLQYERNKNGLMVVRHRFDFDLQFRLDVRDFRLEYEPQFQEEVHPASSDEFRHVLRDGFSVEYRGWKPYVPGASVEIFHEFDNGDTVHLTKVWLTIGASWSHKHKEISAFYRAELPQHPSTDPTVHIFSAAFHYDL